MEFMVKETTILIDATAQKTHRKLDIRVGKEALGAGRNLHLPQVNCSPRLESGVTVQIPR